ncbi:tRNA (guanosine(46)-N7)-methyltransferase TrmB [Francisellaceae bacterium]|nr:tRNA (guanosine(46)-N7)-methyltransferase TrmB [Francisellaceae bacterium]
MDNKPLRTVRSFAKRSGRISDSQRQALQTLGKIHCLPYCKETTNLHTLFSNENPVVIEIGFGNGDTLVQMAKNNPEINYLGMEVYTAGVGRTLLAIEEFNLTNLKLVEHDAVEVLNEMIVNSSITGFQIFFPDPWHKTKHHKRRLIQPEFVKLIIQKLTPNGFIHCATDWENYAEQMLDVLSSNSDINNRFDGYALRPENRPLTKFERRGEKLNHGVWDLIFEKV